MSAVGRRSARTGGVAKPALSARGAAARVNQKLTFSNEGEPTLDLKWEGGDAEKFKEKVSSSEVAFLQHVPQVFKNQFKAAMKGYLRKQAATGQIIEFQAMRLVKDPRVDHIMDFGLQEIDNTPTGLALLRELIPSAPRAGHTNIWVKGKFSLGLVNKDDTPILPGKPSWKDLYTHASAELKKGINAIQPDLMTYYWDGVHRPILKAFELKVGDGENKPGEHDQLMRWRRLMDMLIPLLGLPPNLVPEIKMYFCAWKFGVKDPSSEVKFTPSKHFNNTDRSSKYYVQKLKGAYQFGNEVNVNSEQIEALLQSFEIRRYAAVMETLSKFKGYYSLYGQQFARTWNRISGIIGKRSNNPFIGTIPLVRPGMKSTPAQLESAAAAATAWSPFLGSKKKPNRHMKKPTATLQGKVARSAGQVMQALGRVSNRGRVLATRGKQLTPQQLANSMMASPNFQRVRSQANFNLMIQAMTIARSRLAPVSEEENAAAAMNDEVRALTAQRNAMRSQVRSAQNGSQ
jgi:hypothetical protein